MSETQLVKAIMDTARMMGLKPLRLNAGLTIVGAGSNKRAIRGVEPGTPDILCLLPGGRVQWLEAKTKTGRLSEAQKAWHAAAEKLGHHVAVVRSVQEAVEALQC